MDSGQWTITTSTGALRSWLFSKNLEQLIAQFTLIKPMDKPRTSLNLLPLRRFSAIISRGFFLTAARYERHICSKVTKLPDPGFVNCTDLNLIKLLHYEIICSMLIQVASRGELSS